MSTALILILIVVLVVLVPLFLFEITGITGAPYVPSVEREVRLAFTKLRKVTKKDLVVDLGAGDGIVMKVASDLGASTVGVELNPIMAFVTKCRLRKQPNIKVVCGDMYKYRFPTEATVIYAYANNLTIPRLYKKVQQEANRLNKTLYLISNAFDLKQVRPSKTMAPYYLYKIEPLH